MPSGFTRVLDEELCDGIENVISGTLRIFARDPEEEVCLTTGQTYTVRPRRPHLVTNAGDASSVFLILQGMGEHDFVALA